MRQTSFEYHIHGYRYAPESFHIYKGLPGQEKTELPLSDEQRYQMGYLYLTQGIKSAVDYVKHIERERERKCRLYMTYGFTSLLLIIIPDCTMSPGTTSASKRVLTTLMYIRLSVSWQLSKCIPSIS